MPTTIQPIPKGYKPSPLGPIPQDWEVLELRKLGIFSKGKGISKEELKENGFPCIRYGEIYTTHDYVIKKFNSFINQESVDNTKEIKKGDILFAGSGETIEDIGKSVAYIGKEKAYAGGDIIILSTNNSTNVECLSYLLETDSSRKQKRKCGQGNSVVHIYSSSLSKLKLPLPPLPEQTAIATILSTVDTTIQQTQEMIRKLEIRNKGLGQKLLTGKVRIKGFTGKFKKINADEIFKPISIKNFPNEQLLSATQDQGIIPRDMLEGRVTMPSTEANSYKLVVPGNFIISLRSFQGGLEYSEYRGIVSPAYTVLEPIVSIDDDFYKYYFKSYDFIGHLAVAVIGIRDGKQISFDDFCTLDLPYPDIEEQKAITNLLNKANQEINQYKQKLIKLQTLKKGLMQQLLTGKIRTKEFRK